MTNLNDMYKVSLALSLLIIFTGCKKEKPQVDPQTNATTTVANSTVSGLSPSAVSTGMVVTITGTNFGTSASDVTVLFANNKATIQSVTPTQITAIVPVLQLASGYVSVIIGKQTLTRLSYTTLAATVPAPVMNTILLGTQAQVDSFVVQNAGKEIQITGNLTIGRAPSSKNPDIHDISGLSKLTTVTGALTVLNCPLLTDISGLSNITTAGSVGFYAVGATSISMDKLTTTKNVTIGGILVISNIALNKVSFKSLITVDGNISFGLSPQLASVDMSALTSMSGKLILSSTLLTDMTTFSRLQTAGALSISGNAALASMQGLEQLTSLTGPQIFTQNSNGNLAAMLGGIYITDNAKLSSLSGLQNIDPNTVPDIYITNNAKLNDFCPLKRAINLVKTLGTYSYTTTDEIPSSIPEKQFKNTNHVLAPVTLNNNGNYAATADVLAALTSCQ